MSLFLSFGVWWFSSTSSSTSYRLLALTFFWMILGFFAVSVMEKSKVEIANYFKSLFYVLVVMPSD